MNELKIAKELSLPLDAVTQKLAFLGRTGSGKTYGCKRMVEQMIRAGAQVVILDPVGVWAGLRLGQKSLDVAVLGGLFGDIPLEHTAGAIVADLVVDHGASMVIDLSQALDAPRTRFAEAFARQFFARKKAAPSAVHLVIEECQEFIPQNHQHGEEKMLHEFQRIAKLGRNFGIGLSLISQRPQEVSKKALNQAECVFAFQLTGPHERKALEYWLSDKGSGAEKLADLLPKLEIGAPHVWSPQWLKISKIVHILPIDTLDTSQTPKVGEKSFAQRKLTPIDLGALKVAMASTIEKQKQEDPEVLRARIAELEEQLDTGVPAEPVRVEVPVLAHEIIDRLNRITEDFLDSASKVCAVANEIREKLGAPPLPIPDALVQLSQCAHRYISGPLNDPRCVDCGKAVGDPARRPIASEGAKPTLAHRDAKPEKSPAAPSDDGSLPKVERLILTALAQHQGREISQAHLALFMGVHRQTKSFVQALATLRESGAVQGTMITDRGLVRLGKYEKLPTGNALLEWYCSHKLKPVEAKILKAIRDRKWEAQADLADHLGVHRQTKSFVGGLSHMRGLGLVEGLKLAAVLR